MNAIILVSTLLNTIQIFVSSPYSLRYMHCKIARQRYNRELLSVRKDRNCATSNVHHTFAVPEKWFVWTPYARSCHPIYVSIAEKRQRTQIAIERNPNSFYWAFISLSQGPSHKKRNGTHHPTTHYYGTIPLKPTLFSASISGKFCFNKSKQFCGLAQAIFRISSFKLGFFGI